MHHAGKPTQRRRRLREEGPRGDVAREAHGLLRVGGVDRRERDLPAAGPGHHVHGRGVGPGDAVLVEVAGGVDDGVGARDAHEARADADRRLGVEPELAAAHFERALRALEGSRRGEDEEALVHGCDLRDLCVPAVQRQLASSPARSKSIGDGRRQVRRDACEQKGSLLRRRRRTRGVLMRFCGREPRRSRGFCARATEGAARPWRRIRFTSGRHATSEIDAGGGNCQVASGLASGRRRPRLTP